MNQKGFTLVEIAILIIIVGLLAIPLFQIYDTYQYDKRVRITRENIAKIQGELAIYAASFKRYPIPADAGLRTNNINFGTETESTMAYGLAAGSCGGLGGGICKYNGARDADGDLSPDPILFGSVPVAALSATGRNISDSEALDGWGNRLTYAVTMSQTVRPYNQFRGAIAIVTPMEDGSLIPIGGIKNDAHYAIISHGKDGLGAYNREGIQHSLCSSGIYGEPGGPEPTPDNPVGTAASLDVLNCDPNGLFVLALSYAEAEGARHFDDVIGFGKSAQSNLWANTLETDPSNPDNYIITKNIENLNSGNVGLGTAAAPTERLEVAGAIRAETRTRSQEICDNATTDNCFNVSVLTGNTNMPAAATDEGNMATSPGIRCADGRALTGISRSEEQCANPTLPNVWTGGTCPTVSGRRTWLKGVRSDGTFECSN